MKKVKGDLIKLALEGKFDVIIHGCNTFCNFGAGLAKTVKRVFPEAYEADLQTKKGDKSKLGTYTSATVKLSKHELTIVNGYTQHEFGGNRINVDYDALRSVFKKVKQDFSGKRIGYPAIGAGLARGDWDLISKIINEELEGEDHTFVEYNR